MVVSRLTSGWNTLGRVAICVAMLMVPLLTIVKPVGAATPAPLASYSFDRSSGPYATQTFFDESGNGNDCTGNATNIHLDTGHTNSAIYNGSSGAYATCQNNTLKPTSALTVMAWVSRGDGYYQDAIVTMPRDSSSTNWGLSTGSYSEGYGAYVNTTSGSAWLPSNVDITSDTSWHHLALTYDGTTAKLYFDGALVNSQALTGNIDYSSGTFPLELFTQPSNNNFLGLIDDLRIYDAALTQSQVQTLMSTPVQNSAGHTYSRSMTVSDSSPGATDVTYSTSFTADETYDVQSIVVDFCSNSPLIGEACTAPSGLSLGTPTVANFQIGGTPVSGWTASSPNSTTLMYTGGSGTRVSPGTVITFDMTGITNPSGTGSYYARVLTYSFASPSYSATDTDNFKESGQLALSTAASANFTFEVPETLVFCVYKTTCGDSPVVALGNGTPRVLDTSAADTDSVQFSTSTNAQGGVSINIKGDTLKSGGVQIDPIDGGSGACGKTMSAGTAAFGFDIPSANAAYTVPSCVAGDGTATGDYYFYLAGIKSTYGQQIISSSGPLDNAVATLTFAAIATSTTPAGSYAADFSLVATATF